MQNTQPSDSAQYYNARPKKSAGAGVLFFNAKGEVLIVKPTYLDRWLWVGGGIEENETPLAAAIRECQEEIGITPEGLRFAFVQYRPPKPDGQDDSLQFVFVVENVGEDFAGKLKLNPTEIAEAKFVAVDKLSGFVSEQRAKAVASYARHKANRGLYIEDGVVPASLLDLSA